MKARNGWEPPELQAPPQRTTHHTYRSRKLRLRRGLLSPKGRAGGAVRPWLLRKVLPAAGLALRGLHPSRSFSILPTIQSLYQMPPSQIRPQQHILQASRQPPPPPPAPRQGWVSVPLQNPPWLPSTSTTTTVRPAVSLANCTSFPSPHQSPARSPPGRQPRHPRWNLKNTVPNTLSQPRPHSSPARTKTKVAAHTSTPTAYPNLAGRFIQGTPLL